MKQTIKIKSTITVTLEDGKKLVYVLDKKPMMTDDYIAFQASLTGKTKIAFGMRLVKA